MAKAMETVVAEKGKGWVVTTHRETGDSARVRGAGTGLKVGMFVVRVIWPIKPRGGARCTPASPFADRRSSGRASQPRAHAGMGVKRARKRREQEHVAQATPRIALDARAVPPIAEARFPLATRDGTLDRPRLRRGRDTSSYATHYRSEEREREREREGETKRVPHCSPSSCSSRESSTRSNTGDHRSWMKLRSFYSADVSESIIGFDSGRANPRRGEHRDWRFSPTSATRSQPGRIVIAPRAISVSLENSFPALILISTVLKTRDVLFSCHPGDISVCKKYQVACDHVRTWLKQMS